MKKFLKLFLPAILCFSCLSMPVSADEYDELMDELNGYIDIYDSMDEEDFSENNYYYHVVDRDNLIDNDEELNDRLADLSEEYGIDIVVHTVYSLEGQNPERFNENFLDCNYGENTAVFMLSMQYRDWAFSTSMNDDAYDIFNSYVREYIFDEMSEELGRDDFDDAFDTFVDNCEMVLKQAEKGEPYSESNKIVTPTDILILAAIALGAGLIIALIATAVMKSQLTSVKFQKNANTYIKNGSVNLTHRNDVFLYKTVSKVKRQSSSNGGSSGGGGGGRSSSGKF